MGLIEEYATKWYVILAAGFVAYLVIDKINTARLEKKLGAKPVPKQHHLKDWLLGFPTALTFYRKKNSGLMVDYINQDLLGAPEFENYNSGKLTIAGMELFVTRDPDNIKAVLGTQFNDFSLGVRHAQFNPLLGDGIFSLDGSGWKHSRTMLRPQFAREQVAHVRALEPHVKVLAKHIQKAKGKQFDLQELFFRLTVDSATEFLFGESVESLRDESVGYANHNSDIDGKDEFAEAFNASQLVLSDRVVLMDFYWLWNPPSFRKNAAKVHKFADYYVKKALNMAPEELEKSDGYIFLYELVKQTRDPKVLRDQLLNILVAGRDTTAGLLSFIFFELSQHPEVFQKLREEIEQNFGLGEDAEERIEDITFESLKKCEYLKAVVNECLRLYPSVPLNFRQATKNTTLPNGGGADHSSPVLIKKGQIVFYSIYTTHRIKNIYGKDAEEFRPERWFEESTKKLGWAFLPFNGGPRICLGQQFALTEASYVTVRLLQMFSKIEGFNKLPAPKMSHLTMSLYDGCQISLA
ncbi:cytochrome P450 52A2 [Diutina catenulata]